MPWEEKTVVQSRASFIQAALRKEESFAALCRKYGITRRTGYKWFERYQSGAELSDRSHRPFHSPNKTCEEKERLLLELRTEHPCWGARKLKRYLENENISDLPATSTIADILKRNNCINPLESLKHKPCQRFERANPNELWQADFKGDFSMADQKRCYPLTVLDDHSRYSLAIDAKDNQRLPGVKDTFTRLFCEHGLPDSILTDNGNPFANSQRTGYTFFEVWLMLLDIYPLHGRVMHPQTQGKEERFHRTLKAELLSSTPITNLAHAQVEFDAWRKMYNEKRPHGAIGDDLPVNRYRKSRREMPSTIPEYEYGDDWKVRKVNPKGYVSCGSRMYFLGEAFVGHKIGIREASEAKLLTLCFRSFQIGLLDLDEQMIVSKRIRRMSAANDL